MNLTGKQSLVFQVQSTENAQVALVTTAGDYVRNMYEIVFDAGAKTVIRWVFFGYCIHEVGVLKLRYKNVQMNE